MIKVLIAEDSPVVRKLIISILQSDSGIRVVGVAKNGIEAVEMAERLRPDIITMDIVMPKMDGVEATQLIMSQWPTRIVVVTASVNTEESRPAFQAMKAGALVVVDKPCGVNHKDFRDVSQRLIKTIKMMAEVKVVTRWPARKKSPAEDGKKASAKIIAIGASTGGPAAICQILNGLPKDLAVPILIVQHMTPGFGKAFATWLDSENEMPVQIGQMGRKLKEGQVYVAPDDYHTGISKNNKIVLTSKKISFNHHRPSINYMFDAVAKCYGSEALAILLTGMGEDGALGLREIKQAGGTTIAQDEASSIVFGMPKSAITMGAVDHILPLDEITSKIMHLLYQ